MSQLVTEARARVRLRFGDRGTDLLGALGATLLMLCVHAVGRFATLGDLGGDNDSRMRLVEVRDLLAGQGWFDTTQYRMGLAGGFEMHWSRLVDLPIAVLSSAGEVLTGSRASGEALALVAWPALLFGAAMVLGLRIARRAGGAWATLPLLLLLGLALFFTNQFRPGALDHHNLQLVLLLAMVLGLSEHHRVGMTMAGAAAALMIAIAMESAPYVAVAGALVACGFVFATDGRRATRRFALAFAATAALAFLLTVPPSRWTQVTCDAYAMPQALIGVSGGLGLALASMLPRDAGWRARFAAAAALAACLGVVVIILVPQCLAGPYAGLDPRLQSYLIEAINETQSGLDLLTGSPVKFATYYATPLIALTTLALAARRAGNRSLLVLGCLLSAATLVSLWQVRGAMFSIPLAAVALAIWVGRRRAAAAADGTTRAQLAAIGCWLVSLNVAWAVGAGLVAQAIAGPQPSEAGDRCFANADYAALAALPAGTVLVVSNLGTSVLQQTPHRSIAGIYHRNAAGNLAALDIFMGPTGEAAARMRALGIDYLAHCPGNAETGALARWAPDGFLAALYGPDTPDFLTRVGGGEEEPLQIFTIR